MLPLGLCGGLGGVVVVIVFYFIVVRRSRRIKCCSNCFLFFGVYGQLPFVTEGYGINRQRGFRV